ncbi:MAG: PDZ domain-containing protein, partial [Dehalococcoidia bacterium]|nr:PDZ domain-containing protein [Dehalococcoidia bacterium]
MVILTIVVGIVALSVLIIVHELGHFFAAKATGISVEEFGIGFPPRAYGRKWRGTIYSINWIPFGGFNKIAGEVDPTVPKGLASRGYGIRLLVLSGGIIMNLLLPFVLLSVAYMVPHDIVSGQVMVEEIAPNSPAEMAGIKAEDTLISVEGHEIKNGGDISRYIQLNLGKEISISVEHADASTETVELTPRWRPPR